jgi:hypothetical protein
VRDAECCTAGAGYPFHMCEVVGLVGAEVFNCKDLLVVVSGFPHIGKAARGKRAIRFTGLYQAQSLWHAERSWQDPVDTTSLAQRSEQQQ